jgi:hypothetical protein
MEHDEQPEYIAMVGHSGAGLAQAPFGKLSISRTEPARPLPGRYACACACVVCQTRSAPRTQARANAPTRSREDRAAHISKESVISVVSDTQRVRYLIE